MESSGRTVSAVVFRPRPGKAGATKGGEMAVERQCRQQWSWGMSWSSKSQPRQASSVQQDAAAWEGTVVPYP